MPQTFQRAISLSLRKPFAKCVTGCTTYHFLHLLKKEEEEEGNTSSETFYEHQASKANRHKTRTHAWSHRPRIWPEPRLARCPGKQFVATVNPPQNDRPGEGLRTALIYDTNILPQIKFQRKSTPILVRCWHRYWHPSKITVWTPPNVCRVHTKP